MRRQVTNIVTGFTNRFRAPYAYAEVECGHTHEVPTRPSTIICSNCGTEHPSRVDNKLVPCDCGCTSGKFGFTPDPHNPEHRLIAVGDEVDCLYCDAYEADLAALRDLDASILAHTRFRPSDLVRNGGSILVYRRDNESPTGVRLHMSIEASDEAYEVLTSKRRSLSPLSPTER